MIERLLGWWWDRVPRPFDLAGVLVLLGVGWMLGFWLARVVRWVL